MASFVTTSISQNFGELKHAESITTGTKTKDIEIVLVLSYENEYWIYTVVICKIQKISIDYSCSVIEFKNWVCQNRMMIKLFCFSSDLWNFYFNAAAWLCANTLLHNSFRIFIVFSIDTCLCNVPLVSMDWSLELHYGIRSV